MPVLLYVLILWAIVAVACLVAWGVGKKRGKTEPGEYSDALMYIGFSFGILFGLLVTFGTNHYSSALNEAESEATTLLAMYDDMAPLPPRERAAARHGLICYMRSVVEHDWKAQEDGAAQQAPEPRVRFDNLRRLIRTLPEQTSAGGQSAGPRIIQEIADAGSARQQLLFLARPQIPKWTA